MENTFFFLGLKRNCEQFVAAIALTIPHCQSKLLDRVSLEGKDTTQLFADFFYHLPLSSRCGSKYAFCLDFNEI